MKEKGTMFIALYGIILFEKYKHMVFILQFFLSEQIHIRNLKNKFGTVDISPRNDSLWKKNKPLVYHP